LPPVFWGTTISFRARSGLLEGGDVVGYEASSRLLSARLTGAEMFMQVGPVERNIIARVRASGGYKVILARKEEP
jgi:hypothetical protein